LCEIDCSRTMYPILLCPFKRIASAPNNEELSAQ
jgi:hypothetical protein